MTHGDLPPWFSRPQSGHHEQPVLFARPLEEVLAELQVTPEGLDEWRQLGWVRPAPIDNDSLQPWEERELQVVCDLVRSGLDKARIATLLSELPRPVGISPDRLTYSFRFGWVMVNHPRHPDEVVEEHVDAWMESLADDGRVEDLARLGRQVVDLLARVASGVDAEGTPEAGTGA